MSSIKAIAELAAANGIPATNTEAIIAFTVGFCSGRENNQNSVNVVVDPVVDDDRRYGFIGIGTINSAVIKGLLTSKSKTVAEGTITVSPRNAKRAALLAQTFPNHVRVASSNQEVIDSSDFVFVATPPGNENTKKTFDGLKFRSDQVVVSIIAGASAEVLHQVCNCPTIIQAFPLPPAEDHCSTTVQWPEHKGVAEIFERLGCVVEVPDSNKATAVASISCIMGDFYARLRAAHEWLTNKGVDDVAASEAVS